MIDPLQHYRLSHQTSALGVAYFSPEPAAPMPLEDILNHVRRSPMDEFMRGHARTLLARLEPATLRGLFDNAEPCVRSLILETACLTTDLSDLWRDLADHLADLASETPQLFLRSAMLPDHAVHRAWSEVLAKNIFAHAPLDTLDLDSLPRIAFPFKAPAQSNPKDLAARLQPEAPCPRRPTLETYRTAQDRLYGLGILEGPEMRHQASLSPWGLLRTWRLDRTCRSGRIAYRIAGTQTSYGRGLTLADARASLAMEIVERHCSFADIRGMRVSGSASEVLVATPEELRAPGDLDFLDPNAIRLEVPYAGQELHWIEGRDVQGQPCLIPLQAAYLFTNLDEPRLFSGIGSTGLASGNTPAEAKVSGLLEVVERDSEAVTVFDWTRCFRVETTNAEVGALLEQYRAQGIDPIFQDMTTELGIPCYKCFVLTTAGVVKATGAHLSGSRALISAVTETPFPFPGGPASLPGPTLPVRGLEELPEYATGSATGDLRLLETILADQDLSPYYVDLTTREMRLPVFRSIVPGLEIVSDFDRFTRISPRLWHDVLRVWKKAV